MNWKRSVGLCVCLLAIGASALLAAQQFTGWLTDQACAKASNYTGAVHQKHVSAGQPIVFVGEKDKQVHMIANPDKVKSLVGEKVTLTGTAKNDGSIEVEAASQAK